VPLLDFEILLSGFYPGPPLQQFFHWNILRDSRCQSKFNFAPGARHCHFSSSAPALSEEVLNTLIPTSRLVNLPFLFTPHIRTSTLPSPFQPLSVIPFCSNRPQPPYLEVMAIEPVAPSCSNHHRPQPPHVEVTAIRPISSFRSNPH
jgi:hypothetical protein